VIDRIEMPNPKIAPVIAPNANDKFKTMVEMERDHIIAVLESCNWKISGKGGAAEILDINVNTLNSKIKKLAIKKEIIARKNS
jgi:two-component system response regulator HydG